MRINEYCRLADDRVTSKVATHDNQLPTEDTLQEVNLFSICRFPFEQFLKRKVLPISPNNVCCIELLLTALMEPAKGERMQ